MDEAYSSVNMSLSCVISVVFRTNVAKMVLNFTIKKRRSLCLEFEITFTIANQKFRNGCDTIS